MDFVEIDRFFGASQSFHLSVSCDRPCLELQNASLSFDIDRFLVIMTSRK